MKLLIVEVEPKTAAYLKKGLEESGFVADIAGFHTESAHNRATGPADLVTARGSDEFILDLRFSLQPYIRH